MSEAINIALEGISGLLRANAWFAPVLAFTAGLLTSLTPCSLSTIPLAVAYVGGTGRNEPAAAFRFSLVIAAGMAITLTALGAGASLLGKLVSFGAGGWWYIALGVLMILMALQTWGIFTIIRPTYAQSRNSRKGYAGALLTGMLGGLFSSPCATPVLVALLAIVARGGNPVQGIFLLLLYSVGHGALVVAVGTFIGLAGKLTKSGSYGFVSSLINGILGLVILAAGLYLIYLGA